MPMTDSDRIAALEHEMKALAVRVENLEALHADVRAIKDNTEKLLQLVEHMAATV